MIKFLRTVAAAILLTTQAHAATVSEPTVTGPTGGFQPGVYNDISFETGPLPPLPDGYLQSASASEVIMYVNGGPARYSYAYGVDPSTLGFPFQWLAPAVVPDTMTIRVILNRYKNASPRTPFNGQDPSVITGIMFPIVNGQPETPIFDTPIDRLFSLDQTTGQFRLMALQEPEPTAVPIGGSLPLLVSALGLGALVMRRRGKAALA